MKEIIIKNGREKSILQKHPWIFSGAIERFSEGLEAGDVVVVRSSDGEPLGKAAYSPVSQIRARMWTWDAEEEISSAFLELKIRKAIQLRTDLSIFEESNAVRLINAESDELPGLIVDQYGQTLVMQCLSAGIEPWRGEIAGILQNITGCSNIYERSDEAVRTLEGLDRRTGPILGDQPTEPIEIIENQIHLLVDIVHGHKTGFYLDQRKNRTRVKELAQGRDVLNCFCYTGGFSIQAFCGGANFVSSIDSSADAISLAQKNVEINQFDSKKFLWQEGDVFKELRNYRDRGRKFDMIILDPPKFAPTISQVEKATRAYKDINLLGLKLLREGGLLVTFSCSGGVSSDLFQKVVAGAALDANVHVEMVERLFQSVDHPVALNFPEGAYLKGMICRVM